MLNSHAQLQYLIKIDRLSNLCSWCILLRNTWNRWKFGCFFWRLIVWWSLPSMEKQSWNQLHPVLQKQRMLLLVRKVTVTKCSISNIIKMYLIARNVYNLARSSTQQLLLLDMRKVRTSLDCSWNIEVARRVKSGGVKFTWAWTMGASSAMRPSDSNSEATLLMSLRRDSLAFRSWREEKS